MTGLMSSGVWRCEFSVKELEPLNVCSLDGLGGIRWINGTCAKHIKLLSICVEKVHTGSGSKVAFGRPELPGISSNGDAQPHRQTFMSPPKSV